MISKFNRGITIPATCEVLNYNSSDDQTKTPMHIEVRPLTERIFAIFLFNRDESLGFLNQNLCSK